MVDVRALLDLGPEAEARGVPLVVGAAFSPGLTCVLARHAAAELDEVDEIHVARLGHRRARPAPASTTGRSAARPSTGATVAGCSARAARAASCAGSPIPSAPPTATGPRCPTPCSSCRPSPASDRVTARLAATRRDRLTARLPMLRPPHPEGGLGAVRVEVRGRRGTRRETSQSSAPWTARRWPAGAVAALAAVQAGPGRAPGRGCRRPGRAGRAGRRSWRELARRGVKAAVFDGAN